MTTDDKLCREKTRTRLETFLALVSVSLFRDPSHGSLDRRMRENLRERILRERMRETEQDDRLHSNDDKG